MGKAIRVNYPKRGNIVRANSFVAYGTVSNKKGVVAALLINTKGVVIPGLQRMGPPNWAFRFSNVPDGKYVLVVTYGLESPEMAIVHFRVKAATSKRIPAAITILNQYPQVTDCPVCTSFVTFGFSSCSSVQCTLNPPSGTITQLCGPPNWGFQLDGVDPGTYTISVSCTDNPGIVCNTANIVVQECDK
jgi:hypothetical protein